MSESEESPIIVEMLHFVWHDMSWENNMPTYEYECSACGFAFEELQSMTDKKLTKCPKCKKAKLHRLIGGGSGIIFKGTGFYQTDFKTKPVEKKTDTKADNKKEASLGPSCSTGCACHPSGKTAGA